MLTAVASAQDLPHKVRLGRGAPGYAMHRYYALPEGVSAVAKPAARKARLEKSYFFFFDVDGNGKFNDRGVDGWALAKMPAMLPLEKKTVIGASEYTWRLEEVAELLTEVSYLDVISRGLRVMDSTAITMCMDNKLPIRVFNQTVPGNIPRAVRGESIGTLVR